MNGAPGFEEIFAVMSAAATGDAEARVPIPENPDIGDTATRFAIAVNVLLNDLHFRAQEAEDAHQANQAELERLVAERTLQLRQSEEKFSKAFRASPAAISIATMPEGRWLDVNDAHLAMTGYTREQVIGHTSVELGLVDDVARGLILKAFNDNGFIRNVEISIRNASGERRDTLVSVEQIELDGRKCSLAIQYDITDLKDAEREVRRLNRNLERKTEELEEANQELEAFSYSVAHDLRAPLRSIDAFSKMVLDGYAQKLDEMGSNYLSNVRQSAQRMAQLIDDLLALTKVVRSEIRRMPIDLSAMAGDILERLRAQDPERDVAIKIAEGMEALGDPTLLNVMLENLLGNAWKFTGKRDGARIEFGCNGESGENVYFVRDNGAGFDMAYSGKLFGVFHRLHSVEEFEGTGIGLATVQRVIHRHGGRVWGQGKVDQGATFHFTLGGDDPPK
ncbi:MAG: ATP-binding protein [Fibrobacteria bacterium]